MPAPVSIPPANAIRECPALNEVEENIDMGELLRIAIDTSSMYNECKLRHNSLIDYNSED